jgi:hypothetical protein
MALLYSKITNISISRATKIYPNWDFWFQNIPSGNPALAQKMIIALSFKKIAIVSPKIIENRKKIAIIALTPGGKLFKTFLQW